MNNQKFARRRDGGEVPSVEISEVPQVHAETEGLIEGGGGPSPTASEAAEVVAVQKRLEETFNIGSEELKPSLAQRQDDRYHSFSKYLKRPNVRALNLGMTARVSRILQNASNVARIPPDEDDLDDDAVPGVLSLSAEEKWNLRKQSLKDEINTLRTRVRELEKTHAATRDVGRRDGMIVNSGKPANGPEGLLTELSILRKENYALRNLTDDELEFRGREMIEELRAQVAQLESENAQLQRRLNQDRENRLCSLRPPSDILDLNNVKRMPLDINNVEKERVYKALEDEWKYSTSISRHGSSEPLQNPFERRRFINK